MRNAEAQLTLAVVAARSGDVETALRYGREALGIDRRSRPSLLMVGSELDEILRERYSTEPEVRQFHQDLIATTTKGVA